MKRIAILHAIPPNMGGGAELVCYRTIEALKDSYDLTFYTPVALDFQRISDVLGVSLNKNDFKTVVVPMPFSINNSSGYKKWKMAFLSRHVSKDTEKEKFDLVISTSNEIAIRGAKTLQYIHFPDYINECDYMAKRMDGDAATQAVNLSLSYRLYGWFYKTFLKPRLEDVIKNRTLVNSKWTKGVVKDALKIEADVLYPPVDIPKSGKPWKRRKDGFVCIGIGKSKHTLDIVEIINRLREKGHSISLHIVGVINPREPEYSRQVRQQAEKPHIHLHEGVSRDKLIHIVENNKYGIHGYRWEHFGIAVAELSGLGAIPFVPDEGGQVEIVGDRRLTYNSSGDAVRKIEAVLNSPELQNELREKLEKPRGRFTVKNFQENIRKVVKEELGAE